jgi:ADP-ribose pyrophosphatase YjhB (NUDIX family)
VTRTEHLDDPDAPAPNSIVPAVSAVVEDDTRRILLHRRSDDGRWSIPGGRIELGESAASAVVREVREETGVRVVPVRIVGVYSDPRSVVAYSDGEVRQRFSVCIACRPVGGALSIASGETLEVRYVSIDELAELEMSPFVRLRIDDHLADGPARLR